MSARLWTSLVAIGALVAVTGCSSALDAGDQAAGDTITGRVVKIADGDTITVRTDAGKRWRVRLLAIDTPESYATRYGYSECGGEEAKKATRALVAASPRVKLTTDPTQDKTDRYGLLAYVAQASGGQSFQATLTREGWAAVYRFNEHRPPRLAAKLDPLAKRSGAGVWGACGGFHVREG